MVLEIKVENKVLSQNNKIFFTILEYSETCSIKHCDYIISQILRQLKICLISNFFTVLMKDHWPEMLILFLDHKNIWER